VTALPLALVLASGTALAQDREADAERLFREGQKLLEERRFGEACPKFEQAYNKDRQLGTLINLAFCHKEQGAIWYAWLEFREAEVKAHELNRLDRRDFAKQRLVELEKQLPKLVVDNPQKVALTDVLVEDRKVWEAERGTAFAAEQGQRKFVFRAKGKKPATALINVTGSNKVQHVVVPDMEDGSPDPPPPVASNDGAAGDGAKGADAAVKPDPDAGSLQRTLGWVAIGVGGAAVVVGSITGLITLSSPCSSGKACDPDMRDSARTTGTISDVSFILAGLGVGGGIALLLTAPAAAPGAPASASARASARAPSPAPASRIDVTPRLGLGYVGLSGTF
jgi:hypothetical protein